MPDTLSTRKLSRSILVFAEIDRIFEALVDVDHLRRWWGIAEGYIERRKEGIWSLAWDRSEAGYRRCSSGVIQSYLPPKRLRVRSMAHYSTDNSVLAPMRMGISLTERDGGVRVTVRQEGFGEGGAWDEYYQDTGRGWRETLKQFKAYCESGPI